MSSSLIESAAKVLRGGGLVAFPTETVYGLGADATNAAAVARIFAAKGRPSTNPLIVHVADPAIAKRYATVWPEAARTLADRFWPGPLTLVLPKSPTIVEGVTAGLGTVGLRVPDHPVALELLRAFDGPVAAPSANKSNRISPTTAQHVREELGEAVDMILDGGPCRVGIESTVLDLSGKGPVLLRPGGVSREQIEAIVGPIGVFEGAVRHDQAAVSPGQQITHYAPRTPAYRFDPGEREQVDEILRDRVAGALLMGRGDRPERRGTIIDMPADADGYARELYGALRELDGMNLSAIYVEMPPAGEVWRAVRDRVYRATVDLRPDRYA